MRGTFIVLALALGACAPPPHATLEDLHQAHNWDMEPGADLSAAYEQGARAILLGLSRPDDHELMRDAGYECQFGEAHQTYPDPMAQCTRSFATRACQLDWVIYTTVDKGRVDHVSTVFTRDCVGTDRDWPEPINSAIDDQVAPPALPGN